MARNIERELRNLAIKDRELRAQADRVVVKFTGLKKLAVAFNGKRGSHGEHYNSQDDHFGELLAVECQILSENNASTHVECDVEVHQFDELRNNPISLCPELPIFNRGISKLSLDIPRHRKGNCCFKP
ncbi:hypothetical protein CRG98_046258 [Punica granatum]|uniref:Uncharacterized protein n=1 Tax=Punica granatum TaxID=22663 RepID=A0A2I0HNR7_PUNGR|nr:hypothetical protein CRG98_046258 [Punica granatum]